MQNHPEGQSALAREDGTLKSLILMAAGFPVMLEIAFSVPKLRPHVWLFTVTYLNVVGNVFFPYCFSKVCSF